MDIAEATKSILLSGDDTRELEEIDCFSCKYGTRDFGCIHPDYYNEPVDLYGFCHKWEYCGDDHMSEPFDALKRNQVRIVGIDPERRLMRWADE